jgi:hypothetical protein
MIHKFFFSLVLSVSSIITVTTAATANTPCNQVSNPRPGDRCYQRVSVEARRVGYGDGISRGESSSTSIGGWFITSWNGPVSTSANNGSANLEFIQRGSDFQITNILDEYDRSLLNLRDQVQSYASFPIAGVPVTVGGLTEKINQALQENERRRNYFSQARTNVDRVVVRAEASGRCTRNVLGTCVDNAGGWYSGYVDVYMVYVGSPSEVSSTRERTLNEIQQGLRQLEQARVQQQPQPQDPVIYQPQPQSQGNTTTNARRMLRVDNNTGIEVMYLYISPGSSSDWGPDVLGSGILNSGYYMQFTLNTTECMYDIKAELRDGRVIQGQFDSCRYPTYVLR